jgi:hypothetical protein
MTERKGARGRGKITETDGELEVKTTPKELASFFHNPPREELREAIAFALRRTGEMANEVQLMSELQIIGCTVKEAEAIIRLVAALAGMDEDWVAQLQRGLKLGLSQTLEQVNGLIAAETDPKEKQRLIDLRLKVYNQLQKMLPAQHEVTAKRDPAEVIIQTYGAGDE